MPNDYVDADFRIQPKALEVDLSSNAPMSSSKEDYSLIFNQSRTQHNEDKKSIA